MYVCIRVEIGLVQAAYLSQMGHFFLGHMITGLNKQNRFSILKWHLHAHIISECSEDDSMLVKYV